MTRGIRGATTVKQNKEKEILERTRVLIEEMIEKNNVEPSSVSHVFISVTKDLNATFPARAMRQIDGWNLVPVMCMNEIDVPGSLEKCIRIMMVVRTDKEQHQIHHVFHHEAKKLRPDLVERGE